MKELNGIIIINKEQGYTSMDAVALTRGILHLRRAGHTGTLDPDASGVLPVCLGTATRAVELLTESDKEYRAVMLLGRSTDTQDTSGNVLREADWSGVTPEMIREAVSRFTGEISQVPPMYSAVKIGGKKLVDLARKGKEVERPARKIRIDSISLERIELPEVEMTVRCSKGTYIRTLCHDIGEYLGCGACMSSLVRTRTAGFGLDRAVTLGELERLRDEGRLSEVLIPVDEYFADLPAYRILPEEERFLRSGNRLKEEQMQRMEPGTVPEREIEEERTGGQRRLYLPDGEFLAVYEKDEARNDYKVKKMFV